MQKGFAPERCWSHLVESRSAANEWPWHSDRRLLEGAFANRGAGLDVLSFNSMIEKGGVYGESGHCRDRNHKISGSLAG